MHKKRKSLSGFTLIEIMIVVAIIGIIAGVVIPKFADMILRAQEASTKGSLGAIRSAVIIYYGNREGLFPVVLTYQDNYSDCIGAPPGLGRWGPYLCPSFYDYIRPLHSSSGADTGWWDRPGRAQLPKQRFGTDPFENTYHGAYNADTTDGDWFNPTENTCGWWYDRSQGTIYVNNSGKDLKGNNFSSW